jgi:hypothetical protein
MTPIWNARGSAGFPAACAFAALGVVITCVAIRLGLELGGVLN